MISDARRVLNVLTDRICTQCGSADVVAEFNSGTLIGTRGIEYDGRDDYPLSKLLSLNMMNYFVKWVDIDEKKKDELLAASKKVRQLAF